MCETSQDNKAKLDAYEIQRRDPIHRFLPLQALFYSLILHQKKTDTTHNAQKHVINSLLHVEGDPTTDCVN